MRSNTTPTCQRGSTSPSGDSLTLPRRDRLGKAIVASGEVLRTVVESEARVRSPHRHPPADTAAPFENRHRQPRWASVRTQINPEMPAPMTAAWDVFMKPAWPGVDAGR